MPFRVFRHKKKNYNGRESSNLVFPARLLLSVPRIDYASFVIVHTFPMNKIRSKSNEISAVVAILRQAGKKTP